MKKLRLACGNDGTLFDRIRPFAGLVRNDSFDRPVVIHTGSVLGLIPKSGDGGCIVG
jgi:hypothetical protein